MNVVLQLTAQTPLAFRAGRDEERATTLPYIPGSTLVGGLAAAHTLSRADRDEFAAFFLQGAIRFGNLYPADFKSKSLQAADDQPVRPLPTTCYSCKRFAGFHYYAEEEGDERHGVSDHLIPWALFTLSEQKRPDVLMESKYCDCGESMDRFEGFYRRGRETAEVGKAKINKAIRTRTGISRMTGAVHPGILYSREVLRQGSHFWGQTSIRDDLLAPFKVFVEDVSGRGFLRLGNNRTRGFGQVSLDQMFETETDMTEALAERCRAFDAALRKEAGKHRIPVPHGLYVPLTLTADAIVRDRLLRYQTRLEGNYLAEQWGLSGAKLIYHAVGLRRVTGWNALWGLPKADEWAIGMGAVFLFGLPSSADDSVWDKLLNLQKKGIGARRSEGFGRVVVADSFHWEVKRA
jgi:CRISPR-associated protein Csx10